MGSRRFAALAFLSSYENGCTLGSQAVCDAMKRVHAELAAEGREDRSLRGEILVGVIEGLVAGPRFRGSDLVRVRYALLLSCAASVGCASVPVHRTWVGGELQHAQDAPDLTLVNHCRPSVKVIVVDGAGSPLKGATLVAVQRVSEHAIEETLSVYDYAADPVVTDARGEAYVCAPADLAPGDPAFQGFGGGFTEHDAGRIVVSREKAVVEVRPPFREDIRVTLRPSTR